MTPAGEQRIVTQLEAAPGAGEAVAGFLLMILRKAASVQKLPGRA